MNLQQAIDHCNQVACSCISECEIEHKQLALWLCELQEFRHQEPLSEDEVFELFSKQNFTAYKIDDGTDHNDLVAVDRAFIDFARAIEKAHGVGV
jgi:hypothetical protein